MKKLVLLVLVLTELFSLTTYPDFSVCYDRFHSKAGVIPVSRNYSISFEKPIKYKKYDPFLKIYLIKSHNKKYIRFKNRYKLGVWIASIGKDSIYVGDYAKSHQGLIPAYSSVSTPKGTIISDIFCNVYGIGAGKNNFIPSKYIKFFLTHNNYGDVKFSINKSLVIFEKNPYYNKNFKIGDKILRLNHRRLSYTNILDTILMSKPNHYLNFTILRGKKVLHLKAKVFKKGKLANYLKQTGIITDRFLNITKILPNSAASKHYLTANGKIKSINGKNVTSLDEVNAIISSSKNIVILIEQDGMYFRLNYKIKGN